MDPTHPDDTISIEDVVHQVNASADNEQRDMLRKDGEEVSDWRKEADRKRFIKNNKLTKEYARKLLRII